MLDVLFFLLVVAAVVATGCALVGALIPAAIYLGLGLVVGFALYHVLIARKQLPAGAFALLDSLKDHVAAVIGGHLNPETIGETIEAAVKRYFDEARGLVVKAESKLEDVSPAFGTVVETVEKTLPAAAVVVPVVEKLLPEAEAVLKVAAPVVAAVV